VAFNLADGTQQVDRFGYGPYVSLNISCFCHTSIPPPPDADFDSPMNLVTGLWGMNVHVPGQDIETGVSGPYISSL
jgi:hypothetical protein